MTANQSNAPIVTLTSTTSTPTAVVGTQVAGSPVFMICDNPETIPATTTFTNGFATLWHDTRTDKSTVNYRVYFWHVNGTSGTLKYGITIGNGSNITYNITNVRGQFYQDIAYSTAGINVAKALVGNTLDSMTPVDSSINAGKLGVVFEKNVNAGKFIGGVIEFTLSNAANQTMIYRVRSSVANNVSLDLRNNQTAVIAAQSVGHPRGSWDFSNIKTTIDFDANISDKIFNVSNGSSDDIMKAATSYDAANAANTNKGHYGCIYEVSMRLINSSNAQKTVKIYATPRGGSYGGAFKFTETGTTYGIPSISGTSAVLLGTVTIPANTTTAVQKKIFMSHAGSLSTPVGLRCISS